MHRGGGCGVPGRRTPVGAMFGVVSVISIERLPSDPLAALRELAAGEAQLDRLRREHVGAARAGGASWGEVGRALGVSEDAVLAYYFADARREFAENGRRQRWRPLGRASHGVGRRRGTGRPPKHALSLSGAVRVVLDTNVFVSRCDQHRRPALDRAALASGCRLRGRRLPETAHGR